MEPSFIPKKIPYREASVKESLLPLADKKEKNLQSETHSTALNALGLAAETQPAAAAKSLENRATTASPLPETPPVLPPYGTLTSAQSECIKKLLEQVFTYNRPIDETNANHDFKRGEYSKLLSELSEASTLAAWDYVISNPDLKTNYLEIDSSSNRWFYIAEHFSNKLKDEFNNGKVSLASFEYFTQNKAYERPEAINNLLKGISFLSSNNEFIACSPDWAKIFNQLVRDVQKSVSPEAREIVTLMLDMASSNQAANFEEFNKWCDLIKKEADWTTKLDAKIADRSDDQLQKLAALPLKHLLGFDREVCLPIFSSLRAQLINRGLATAESTVAIEQKIDSLQTEILPDTDLKYIGGGAVNKVYVTPENRVFKPDPSQQPLITTFIESGWGTAAASGIPPGIQSHSSARSVATSVVDKLLYGEDGQVSVETRYAVVNGQRGILMEKALGGSPKIERLTQQNLELEEFPELSPYLEAFNTKETLSEEELNLIAMITCCRDVSGKKVSGKWQFIGYSPTFEHFDPHNAHTAYGLLKTQILDYITGQVDRHPKNYFIYEGKVLCIDNDCSFGFLSVPEKVDVREQPNLMSIIPNNASLMLRPPQVITDELKAQINRLYIHQDELVGQLELYMNDKEVNATLDRLQRLYEHVNAEGIMVVDNPESLLGIEAKMHMDSNNSYWARELLIYDSSDKGWNYLRAHRPCGSFLKPRTGQ